MNDAPHGPKVLIGTKDERNLPVPDYLHDLNAIHSAVLNLRFPIKQTLWSLHQIHLEAIVARRINPESVSFQWECQNAAPGEHSEALLRTIRKWQETVNAGQEGKL
jgi:hypothetical protein